MVKSSFLLIVLLQLFACSSSQGPTRSAGNPPDVPLDLRITVGEGGGITGAWGGYTILGSDSVLEWKGRGVGEQAKPVGIVEPDSVLAWWRFITESGTMERLPLRPSANFLQMISISTGGTTVDFAWSPPADKDTAISALAALRTRCLRAVQKALHR